MLRGDKPIRARLRPLKRRGSYGGLTCDEDVDVSGSEKGDIETGKKKSFTFPISNCSDVNDINSGHGLLRDDGQLEVLSDNEVQNPLVATELRTELNARAQKASADNSPSIETPVSNFTDGHDCDCSDVLIAGQRTEDVIKRRTHGTYTVWIEVASDNILLGCIRYWDYHYCRRRNH